MSETAEPVDAVHPSCRNPKILTQFFLKEEKKKEKKKKKNKTGEGRKKGRTMEQRNRFGFG
jgi:hypothetical protein